MTEQQVPEKVKQSKLNIKLLVIIGVILVGAVGAFAYTLWPTSEKDAYFKAEIDTFNFLKDQVVDRFEDEIAWTELSKEKPTSSTITVSAEYNDPYSFGDFNEIEEIINQSSLTLHTETDMKGKQLLVDAEANIAGITFEDFRIYLTDERLLIELPFLDDALQIESKDLSAILHEIDPYFFSEDEEYDFSIIFDLDNYPIPEDDQQYIRDKYGKFLYDHLPDEAFSSETDNVKINGDNIKAEKITAHLTEEHVKTLLTDFYTEIQDDDRFKEIVEEYLKNSFVEQYEIDEILDLFGEGLDEAKEEIEDIRLPDGIQSTIWVKDGLIVQREFNVADVEFDEEFKIKGIHVLDQEEQILDYELTVDDGFHAETMSIKANLSNKNGKINDKITLDVTDAKAVYEAKETKSKSDRKFERSISFQTPFESGSIHWDGNSSYDKDEMSSSNRIYLEADDLGGDIFNLQLDVEGKQIRGVEEPNPDNIKDIGKMTEDELFDYIYFDAQEQFFDWYMENFGMSGF